MSHVVVVQVPQFSLDRPLGGAEAMAADVVSALGSQHQVTVLCGRASGSVPGSRRLGSITVHPAFPITDDVRAGGHIKPSFTPTARNALSKADIVLTVERSLGYHTPAARIVMLGGVGYPHSLDLLRHGAWDRLVVPSPLVARKVVEHAPDSRGVVTVLNGIDTSLFCPPRHPSCAGRLRLLLAARPVEDKGMTLALDLTRALNARGTASKLICTAQPDGLDGLGVIPDDASRVVEAIPWVRRGQMPELYAGASLTLCLGTASEGFGLVAAESVACGTPVLATPTGFLAHLLPPRHGIDLVDPELGLHALTTAALRAVQHGPVECQAGRRYLKRRYPLSRMTSGLLGVVDSILGEVRTAARVTP